MPPSDESEGRFRLFVGLVHYPVYNRRRDVVATAVTNLDIHDIARASCTYGAEAFFILTPLDRQRWLVGRILRHWQEGRGAEAHPNRREALARVSCLTSIEEAAERICGGCGRSPRMVATTARSWPQAVGYGEMRRRMVTSGGPHLILFGTGWGLTDEVLARCHDVLKPILKDAPYNHLSVRSAAAVILDRLLGDRSESDGCDPADASVSYLD